MRCIVIYGLPGCTIYFNIFSWTVRFLKRRLLNIKPVFWFSLQLCWNISHSKKNSWMYIDIHVKYLLFLSYFNATSIFLDIVEKYPNIKFQENPSIGCGVVPSGRTNGQTYMTKLTTAFCNSANAPIQMWRVSLVRDLQTCGSMN